MNADDNQIAAIKHGDGPALVTAGPGSGKTFVLTKRVQYLIQILGVPPKEILVLTFSKKAADEMKERFLSLVHQKETDVTFGTFHAVFLKFLKFYARDKNYTLISEGQKKAILRNVLKENKIIMDYPEFLSEILFDIQRVKSANLSEEEIHSKHLEDEVFCRIVKNYEAKKAEKGFIDFDDILTETVGLLSERPDLLSVLQKRFVYVLIDEFQDINPVQYEIVCMICDRHKNLFAVGDDDQSIYSFRGARPDVMIHFEDEYPGCKRIALSNNYRSGEKIVKAAGKLIVHNETRIEKQIRATSGKCGEVFACSFENKNKEYSGIADILKNLSPEERKKTVILTRTNEIDPYLVFALKSSRIPFTFTSKAGSVYDGIVGKDILAYLNMTQGEIRKDDFLRVINRPNRYVPTSMIAKEELNFERLMFDYRDKQYLRDNLRIFKKNLDIMGRLDPYAAIIYLRKAVGYEEYLKRNVLRIQTGTGSAVEENTVMDDLTNITEMAKNFETISDFIRACTQLSDELAGEKTVSGSPGNDKFRKGSLKEETEKNPGVSVMTMHASKGLEFDTVILPDINEGRVPIRQAVSKEEIEEERRILYVAMTRAKERLFLCSVNERNPFLTDKGPVPFSGQRKVEQKTGQTVPSRFLDEILN